MNTTVNGSSCSDPLNSTAAKLGQTFAYCLLFVVSLVGNSFIGIVVYKTETLRKPINFFIVNMAMSDLVYPILMYPWKLTQLYGGRYWLFSGPLGQASCKLIPVAINVSSLVSIQSLVLIAVNRLRAVVFPLRSPLVSSKLCPYFILATWIIAMAVCSPFMVANKLVGYRDQLFCLLQWNDAFGESSSLANYFVTVFVVFFYIPIALLTVLYSIIIIQLRSQIIPGEQSANAEQQRERRNRKVLKMAIAIVVVFVLCWLPFSVVKLLKYFAWNRKIPCHFSVFRFIAPFLSHATSAVNPCICFIFSANYRRGIGTFLKCRNEPLPD